MKINKQNGFTVVEGLLIVLVLAVIGFGGYYIWSNQNKDEDKPAAATTQTSSSDQQTDTQTPAAKETDSWYLFVSKNGEYKMRLADGLVFTKAEADSPYLSILTDSLTTKAGTKATVIDSTGGRDGVMGMYTNYFETGTETKGFGTKQSSFTTDSGLTVDKYLYVQETEPEGPGLLKGGKRYTYYIVKDGKDLTVQYSLAPNDNGNVELVEKMVKTVELK